MRLFSLALAAVVVVPNHADAQSILERVLGQIDGAKNFAQVNGTFANIAENVGTLVPSTSPTMTEVPLTFANAPADAILWGINADMPEGVFIRVGDIGRTFYPVENGTLIEQALFRVGADSLTVDADGSLSVTGLTGTETFGAVQLDGTTDALLSAENTTAAFINRPDTYVYDFASPDGDLVIVATQEYVDLVRSFGPFSGITITQRTGLIASPGAAFSYVSPDIDGSITNIIIGVTSATQEAAAAGTAQAFDMHTVDLGDMATTVLGAVNTGVITLGVNSAVADAATRSTSVSSSLMTQIGGSADTGALVLNVSSNAGAINGTINNTLATVNGSIGNMSTTTLGAVNTGTITSGVTAAMQGIVGMSN